jgi:hypothetical protein
MKAKHETIGWRNIIYAMMQEANISSILRFSKESGITTGTIYHMFNRTKPTRRPTVNKLICFARRNFKNDVFNYFNTAIGKTAKSVTGSVTMPNHEAHYLLRQAQRWSMDRPTSGVQR